MMDFGNSAALSIAASILALKLLLIDAYFSTDFEVHRNWLAITASLPMNEWYTATHSEWTLDYPPFFAYFEWILARFARLFDAKMLETGALNYASTRTIVFQRLSVIVTDLLYVYGALRLSRTLSPKRSSVQRRNLSLFALLVCNVGFLFVDSVHFQYNGFLSGIFLLAVDAYLNERRLLCAFLFATLLNLKHIYLYIAPAFIATLFRDYCLIPGPVALPRIWRSIAFSNVIKLGAIVLATFAASIGPFRSQLPQLLARLFPFKRGLTHAYWAPNFWALYNAADFVLSRVTRTTPASSPSYTSGLVREFDHIVLPRISPAITALLSLLAILPFCAHASLVPPHRRHRSFLRLIAICALSSFLFGWHVHEKAILVALLPLTVLAVQTPSDANLFVIIAGVGHFSLFPLLFEAREWLFKVLAWFAFTALSICVLSSHFHTRRLISKLALLYVFVGPVLIECTHLFLHSRFPFLPLMLSSIYVSFGVVYTFLLSCIHYSLDEEMSFAIAIRAWFWRREQTRLKHSLRVVPDADPRLRYIGGVDLTMEKDGDEGCACLVVIELPSRAVVYKDYTLVHVESPYIAGYLAFREVPPIRALIDTFRKTRTDLSLDALLVDGNGVLHPAGFGLASHVGVVCDVPSIGVAKNLHLVDGLLNEYRGGKRLEKAGDFVELIGATSGEVLGVALRTSESAMRPVYVSVGHRVDLEMAVRVVRACCSGTARVPEPVRLADIYSREFLRRIQE